MVHKSDYIESGGIPIVNPMNIIDGCIVKEKLAMVSPKKAHELARYTLQKNDILIARRGDLSKCAIVNEQSSGWLCGTGSFFLHIPFVEPQYIMLFYLSEYVQTILKRECVGATMENLNQGVLGNIPLLLPPIEEQKRIIQKVSTLETSVFNIDSGRQEVRQLISQVKSKILELAISGKLVPQDRADEPAADLLKRVNPNAVVSTDTSHYKVPSNWICCKLYDICNISMGQSPNGESLNSESGIEFHQGKIAFTDYLLNKSGVFTSNPTKIVEGDSLLLCVRAPVGISNYCNRTICIGRGLCAIQPKKDINIKFLYFLLCNLKSYFESKATGTTFKSISADVIKNAIINVPPLNEQMRIVNKVENLFTVINQIQQSLE